LSFFQLTGGGFWCWKLQYHRLKSIFVLYFCLEELSGQFVQCEKSMANKKQLAILKNGVEAWNKWWLKHLDVEIDLKEANLNETILSNVNLWGADLRGAQLRDAELQGADLRNAHLIGASLEGANLRRAYLVGTDFSAADLRSANLWETDLNVADLTKADLRKTNLVGANLRGANLSEAQFSSATIGYTIFGAVDVSETLGLEEVHHDGPSPVSTDVFTFSEGKIPEVFLRGCGLSDTDIEYAKLSNPDLTNEEVSQILYKIYDLRATRALQISPLFISYSHDDSVFVDELEYRLNKKGIRFWRDVHDVTAGRLEKVIDRAMRLNPTVLLVLSEHALKSDWVEHEVRTARQLEKELGRDTLCPVALDDSWKSSHWPKRVMEQIMEYNLLDFSAWKDDVKFESMFRKLIDGLELFYKG
jgi:uncharacterized protein YjbI with pentapeptide repeats